MKIVEGIMRFRIVLSALLACMAAAPASAEKLSITSFSDGAALYEQCRRTVDGMTFMSGHCYGYVSGVVDTLNVLMATKGECGFTLPDKVSEMMVGSAVLAYLSAHPEEHGDMAALIVTRAMEYSFPCREQ